jgi:hypothetical protein
MATAISGIYTRLYPGYAPKRRGPATKCKGKCPHGSACCLDGGMAHTLHICHTPSCPCHGAARYAKPSPAMPDKG